MMGFLNKCVCFCVFFTKTQQLYVINMSLWKLLLLESAARIQATFLLQLEQELVDTILRLRLACHVNDAMQFLNAHKDSVQNSINIV